MTAASPRLSPFVFLSRAPLGTVDPYTLHVLVVQAWIPTYHTSAIPHPFRCAAAAVRLYTVIGRYAAYRYHTPHFITPQNTRCGCSFVLSHPLFITLPLIYHTPKHTLWVFGRAITPPYLSHPLGTDASCTLSPGVHNISHPPQYDTPGDNIFKPQNVITGRGVLYIYCVIYGGSHFCPDTTCT